MASTHRKAQMVESESEKGDDGDDPKKPRDTVVTDEEKEKKEAAASTRLATTSSSKSLRVKKKKKGPRRHARAEVASTPVVAMLKQARAPKAGEKRLRRRKKDCEELRVEESEHE